MHRGPAVSALQARPIVDLRTIHYCRCVPAWLALVPTSSMYLGWLFLAEFLLFMSTGPVNVVIVSVVPVGVRAMAMAVCIFTIHLLGDAISPPIIGMLADASGLARAVLIDTAAIAISGLIWTGTAAYSSSLADVRSHRR